MDLQRLINTYVPPTPEEVRRSVIDELDTIYGTKVQFYDVNHWDTMEKANMSPIEFFKALKEGRITNINDKQAKELLTDLGYKVKKEDKDYSFFGWGCHDDDSTDSEFERFCEENPMNDEFDDIPDTYSDSDSDSD